MRIACRRDGRLLAVLAALAGIVGCAAPTPSPTIAPSAVVGPVETTVTDGLFRLTAHADQATYLTSDAIGMQAVLTFLGPAATFPATGSGSGLVNFDVRQLDGPLVMQGVWTADCAPQPLMFANQPRTFPFTKSGAYGPSPSVDFWTSYFADPLLHLPAGRWSLVAEADITGVDCNPSTQHNLTASVEVTVLP